MSPSGRPGKPQGGSVKASIAIGILLPMLLVLAACERRPVQQAAAPDESLLVLETPYPGQQLGESGEAQYRFRAARRGAYLIVVSDNPHPLSITLTHPKRTCYLVGNGSCELVSGPDETYDFQISSDSGEDARFTVMVTHSEGRGQFEGEVGDPVAIDVSSRHRGTVGVRESSYYTFRPAAAGPHTISLTGARSNLVWRLFDAPVFDVILQECDFHPGAVDESCRTLPLHAKQTYYVKVEELSGVPGSYRLMVAP